MLNLSTRARYGLRAMIELSKAPPGAPVLAGYIAERQGLPRKYLHSILVALKTAGLVQSVRGASGGYLLSRSARSIRALEVLEALEGKLRVNACVDDAGACRRSRGCAARALYRDLNRAMIDVLERFTLEDLARH
jgi:Rrf2 family protein